MYAHVRCKGNLVCVNESFCHVSSGWISSSGGHTRLRYMILALRLTYALRARLHIMRHNELEWIYGWNVGPFLAALQYFVRQISVFTGLACCTVVPVSAVLAFALLHDDGRSVSADIFSI